MSDTTTTPNNWSDLGLFIQAVGQDEDVVFRRLDEEMRECAKRKLIGLTIEIILFFTILSLVTIVLLKLVEWMVKAWHHMWFARALKLRQDHACVKQLVHIYENAARSESLCEMESLETWFKEQFRQHPHAHAQVQDTQQRFHQATMNKLKTAQHWKDTLKKGVVSSSSHVKD